MRRIGILASGTGSNAQAIIEKAKAGILEAEIALVFSNVPGAAVLTRARQAQIPAVCLDHRKSVSREAYDAEVSRILAEARCEFVVLAGYMRLLSGAFLKTWPLKVVNIHPALLPAFPGTHGARDALEYGVRLTGPSVHFVEEEMDRGPLIIQAAAPVLGEDTVDSLQKRIHSLEHRIYPQAIQWLVTGRIQVEGRRVTLSDTDGSLAVPPPNSLIWPPLEEGF